MNKVSFRCMPKIPANSVLGNVGNAPAIPSPIPISDLPGGEGASPPFAQSDITGLVAALAALAPLVSPALTGTPTAPTAAPGTNTTQLATCAFVKAAIDLIIAAAPGALDTLNELAAALGDDADFAGTMTAALAGKAATSHSHSADDVTNLAAIATSGSASDLGAGTLPLDRIADGSITNAKLATPGGGGASLTRISGASGAAGADLTWQRLAANAAANATTTLATVMTTTGVGPGTWAFKYLIRYQAAATTTGVDFAVNHTGTTGAFVASSWFTTSGGAAANGLADQVTNNTANMIEGKSQRAKNAKVGASLGVDTANADMLMIVEGIIVVTGSGSLELKHASEVAAASTVMADTVLELHKIA